MKASIGNESIFPNAMIRDILVANPQSAKSSEVMAKIDERFIPMPAEMKTEVADGINIIGGKDELEMELSGNQYDWGLAFQRLQRHYLHDTTNLSAIDSLKTLYSSISRPEVKYRLYSLLIDENNLPLAESVLDSVPFQFSLNYRDIEMHNEYETLHSFFSNFLINGNNVLDCDSSDAAQFLPLLEHGSQRPGALARNIVISRGGYNYTEPINLPLGSSAAGPSRNPDWNADQSQDRITIFPNPSGDYFIADYEVSKSSGSLVMQISDNSGRTIMKVPLKNYLDQKVVVIANIKPGVYVVYIRSGGKNLASSKFVKL